jgi:transketolase N-terminal domain/subunit
MTNKLEYQELESLAQRGRWLAISTVAGSGAGHVGGPFSAMDMLIALYFRVMNIRPEEAKFRREWFGRLCTSRRDTSSEI